MKQKLISPVEGEGLHKWLLSMSRDLLMRGIEPDKVRAILLDAVKGSNRTTQDVETEITNVVEGAVEFLIENPGFRCKKSLSKWVDPMSFVGMGDIMKKDNRPDRLPFNPQRKIEALAKAEWPKANDVFSFEELFSNVDFLICGVKDQREKPIIDRVTHWVETRLWKEMQFIVPNYFRDAKYGRCDFGIARRLFLVIEFDKFDKFDQLLLLDFLGKFLPLVLIVFSGNRSYHGWFACYGVNEYKVKTFCRKATELGADRTTWSPSQYVRMPNGKNYKYGTQQEIVFYNYDALDSQIVSTRKDVL